VNSKMPEWYGELQDFILELEQFHRLNRNDLLAFFSATLCGQFATADLDEEFVRATLDRMYDEYKRIRKKIGKKKKNDYFTYSCRIGYSRLVSRLILAPERLRVEENYS